MTTKDKSSDITYLHKRIRVFKRRLLAKAKKSGLYENFGQKQVKILMDGFEYHDVTLSKPISDFNKWCMELKDTDL